ncbi:MAG: DUF1801 domain-containing protein [Aquiluna sp.]|nr:DUF1801 domain-containing protein [Aquiluna sp.]MCF8545687.1 DUF1801 domain-containing protein [Aquiluna sp.]
MATEPQPSDQIDSIIASQPNWKGQVLEELREVILSSSSAIKEDVKWKMPSKPLGSPTWEADGIVCVADYLKNAVRLTFPKGARIKDSSGIFNARLDSKTVRAIDFAEGQEIQNAAFIDLLTQGVELNRA